MWEIGGLTENLFKQVESIALKGATKLWNEIDKNAIKDREIEINKLLNKIKIPKKVIRKRKIKKVIEIEPIFQSQEVFAIKLDKFTYGATILITTDIESENLYYYFSEIILKMNIKPTINDILQSKVHAGVGIGFKDIRYINHKKLVAFKDNFEKLGVLEIPLKNRKLGVFPGKEVSNYDEFIDEWNWKGDKRNRKKLRDLKRLLKE